jgi:protein-S-isoprenylcysteine O-methyltransferase Ste14
MTDLNRKALVRLLVFTIVLAALLFLPAGTIHYWQAWAFLAVFVGLVLGLTVDMIMMKKDPKLLERRLRSGPVVEKRGIQKIVQTIALIAFVALVIVPALDHRFEWSTVPLPVVLAGDVLVMTGVIAILFVFKENSFASAVIEVDPEQRVISTGPYAFVRHPMYLGALIMLFGAPLALGSWWGLWALIPITAVIVVRLLDEEGFLTKNLAGYAEYQRQVRYRLVPFLW